MFRTNLFPTFYETPDGTTTAGAQPPQAPAQAPPQTAPAPWSADLEQAFANLPEEVRADAIAAADGYMRERVQPRITQLESSPAQRLYKDLTDENKVDTTVAAVVAQVYGEDVAQKFIDLFGEDGEGVVPGQEGAAVEAAAAAASKDDEEQDDPRLQWVEEQQAREQRQQDEAEYSAALDEIIAEPEFKLVPEDKDLLHPFMASSETVGEAVAKYHAYVEAFSKRHGVTPAEAEQQRQEGQEPPPATLGSQGAAGPSGAAPAQVQYKTWDDLGAALTDYQAERVREKSAPATL